MTAGTADALTWLVAQQQGGQSPTPSSFGFLVPLALVFFIFYFLTIRPQQKKMKEHDAMLKNIKRGDEVMTSGGLFGRVREIAENVVTIEVADKIRVRVARNHISRITSDQAPAAAEKPG